jgi:hypothetical protein
LEKSSPISFTGEDTVAINQIIIRCAAKLQNVIDEYSNPKEHANKLARQLNSGKTLSTIFLFSRLLNFSSTDLYSPSELKTMILRDIRPGIDNNAKNISTVDDLTEAILSNKFISGSILSKVYNEFMRNGLLVHFNKKDQLKNFRASHAKKHKNIYKTKGRISFYAISPEAEITKKILGNPKALEIIDSSLKKSGLLDRSLKLLMKAAIYLLIGVNDKEADNLKKAVVALFEGVYPGIQLDMKDSDSLIEILFIQDENMLEKIAEMLVSLIVGKLGFPYIIYGLSMLEDE